MYIIEILASQSCRLVWYRCGPLCYFQLLDQMVGVLRQLSALVKLEDKEPIASCVYDVFWMCVHGGSQVDAMHLSQHLDFFLAQLNVDVRETRALIQYKDIILLV